MFRRKYSYLGYGVFVLLSALILAPLLSIFTLSFQLTDWSDGLRTVLPRYFSNTLILMSGTAVFSAFLGGILSLLVTRFQFPLVSFFQWGFLAPLAIPAFLSAFVYADFLEYAGPVQFWLRESFPTLKESGYRLPEIRSLGGAIVVMSLGLFPYSFALISIALRQGLIKPILIARSLGATPRARIFGVILPHIWPAIVAGMVIAAMEAVAEFGAMEFLGVQTLTTGIFTIWLEARDATSAARLALMGIVIIGALVLIERRAGNRTRFERHSEQIDDNQRQKLPLFSAILALIFCALVFFFSFVLPVYLLLKFCGFSACLLGVTGARQAIQTSVILGASVSGFVLLTSFLITFGSKFLNRKSWGYIGWIASFGYALPGAIIGLGSVVFFGAFDRFLNRVSIALFDIELGLVMTGGMIALIFSLSFRFYLLGHSAFETGFSAISSNLMSAARSLGAGPRALASRVALPMSFTSVIATFVFVFVDMIKELPATLLLRPFGMATLATEVYDFATLEDYSAAAPPALLIILLGTISVVVFALQRIASGHFQARKGRGDPPSAAQTATMLEN